MADTVTAHSLAAGTWGYVSLNRFKRIWRREGLRVPSKQPKRGRLWLNDGSCLRLRPIHKNHVWSYDFVQDESMTAKLFACSLSLMSTAGRASPSMFGASSTVRGFYVLSKLFLRHGPPEHIRSDNGRSLTLRRYKIGSAGYTSKPCSSRRGPWENVQRASTASSGTNFDRSFTLKEAQVLIEQWQRFYNTERPHSARIQAARTTGTLAKSRITTTLHQWTAIEWSKWEFYHYGWTT